MKKTRRSASVDFFQFLLFCCNCFAATGVPYVTGLEATAKEEGEGNPSKRQQTRQRLEELWYNVYLPLEIQDNVTKNALRSIASTGEEVRFLEASKALETMGVPSSFTLTQCGDKGGEGPVVNQDRAFVLLPRHDSKTDKVFFTRVTAAGVLDGHGWQGHKVAEFGRDALIDKIELLHRISKTSKISSKDALSQYFKTMLLDIDQSIPPDISIAGGATVSMVVQVDEKLNRLEDSVYATSSIYLINAGDSQTLLASYDPVLNRTLLLASTRRDKPDIPDEQQRLLQAGAHSVTEESDEEDARVWYETKDGGLYGLAMSRSLGDTDMSGVTAEPLVSVWDKESLYEQVKQRVQSMSMREQQECTVTDDGKSVCQAQDDKTTSSSREQPSELRFFALSATDGLLDYLDPQAMVEYMGPTLFSSQKGITIHSYVAAQNLFAQATVGWNKDFEGSYRDDMAMAVVELKI